MIYVNNSHLVNDIRKICLNYICKQHIQGNLLFTIYHIMICCTNFRNHYKIWNPLILVAIHFLFYIPQFCYQDLKKKTISCTLTVKLTESILFDIICECIKLGARCSSVVRAFAHGAIGRRIDPSWGGPIGLFLVPASAPRLV